MIKELLYRGPSLINLHDKYAKQSRVDTKAPIYARTSGVINASTDAVWAKLVDIQNWQYLFSGVSSVTIQGEPAVDTSFSWKNGIKIKSQFAIVAPGRQLSWTGRAAGANAVHLNILESIKSGQTKITIEESMAGLLLPLFYSSKKLKQGQRDWILSLQSAF